MRSAVWLCNSTMRTRESGMGLFGEFFEELEEREERREYFEERSFFSEFFLPDDAWELEGSYYDPYSHGDMFYDPQYGNHGVMYAGMWHPLEYQDGNWIFVHPHRFRLPRNYRPGNLTAPQPANYNVGYGQTPQSTYGAQPATGWMPSTSNATPYQATYAPQASTAAATYCTACGAELATRARPCPHCGRAQVL
jgi:hypothetical protein